MAIVDDLCVYFGGLGTVGTYDPAGGTGTIFGYRMPDQPQSLLAVLPTTVPGITGPYDYSTLMPAWEIVSLSLFARDPVDTVAYARAYAAYTALLPLTDKGIGSTYIFRTMPLSPGLLPANSDPNNLFVAVVPLKVQKAIG